LRRFLEGRTLEVCRMKSEGLTVAAKGLPSDSSALHTHFPKKLEPFFGFTYCTGSSKGRWTMSGAYGSPLR